MASPAAAPPRPAARPRRRWRTRAGDLRTLVPGIAVVLLVLLLAARSPRSEGPSATARYGTLAWSPNDTASNGVVSMHAGPGSLSVTPAPPDPATGLEVRFVGLEELGSQGGLMASTLPGPVVGGSLRPLWSSVNQSGPAGFVESLSFSFVVVRPSWVNLTPVPTVTLRIASGTSAATAANVSLGIDVEGWPWVHPSDSLVLFLALSAVGAPAGRLVNGSVNSVVVANASTGTVAVGLTWSGTMQALDAAGDRFMVPDAAALVGNSTRSMLEIGLQSGSGGYVGISTQLVIGVPPANVPGPLPVEEVGLGVGWAAVVGTVAWVAVQRAGERPPDLVTPRGAGRPPPATGKG